MTSKELKLTQEVWEDLMRKAKDPLIPETARTAFYWSAQGITALLDRLECDDPTLARLNIN